MLLISGCATSYQPKVQNGGFSVTQTAPNVFRVAFNGNAFTSTERTQDLALLRAAEIVLEHGFIYFALIDESGSMGRGSTASASFQRTMLLSGPPVDTRATRSGVELLVKGFESKPDGIFSYDAASLQQTIKRRYGVP